MVAADRSRRNLTAVLALVAANTLTDDEVATIAAAPAVKFSLPSDLHDRMAALVGRPLAWQDLPEARRMVAVVVADQQLASLDTAEMVSFAAQLAPLRAKLGLN